MEITLLMLGWMPGRLCHVKKAHLVIPVCPEGGSEATRKMGW
jgi:hypothetical protein